MSIIGSNILAGAAGSGVSGYEIEHSLRFDGGGSKLVLASPSSSYQINKFTMSCWVKMGPIASDFRMMGRDGGGNTAVATWCNFNPFGNNVIASYFYTASINGRQVLNTLGTQRDPSAWYHIVFGYDSGSGNTQRIWVNGVEQTTGKDTISGSAGFEWSSTYPFVIGGGTSHGYVAEYHFIDNNWLDSPDDFGEYNDQGVWVPKEYTGSHGTNGFYLKFDPSATNGIGHDHSGTGNHLTASGFTTSGTGTDVMSDTPTTNYGTFNAVAPSGIALSEGNLSLSFTNTSSESISVPVTMGATSGKFYVEFKYTYSTSGASCGVGVFDLGTETDLAGYTAGWSRIIYDQRGVARKDNSNVAINLATTRTAGDILGIAVDCDNGEVRFYVNGTLQHTETGLSYSAYGFHFEPNIGGSNNACTVAFNGGQRAFEQTVPTGYSPLNTSNLPAPDIADGSQYFNTVLYAGTGGSDAITGVGFQPDFTWIKGRTATENHTLVDAVRGAPAFLISNSTYQEQSYAGKGLTSFDSDGFTVYDELTGGYAVNQPGRNYVAWNWKANGSGSSNTDGSITSTVSANPTAGFSIVSYTGNGTSGATVGHGLGVAASMLIVKNRDRSDSNIRWAVYHRETGNTDVLYLNESNAAAASSAFWNDTTPTSTVFTIGTDNDVNTSGDDYIAYCFAEVENYSRIGSYVGNGSSDGPFVYCGFKPAFVMIKVTNVATTSWIIRDTARNAYNIANAFLLPNLSSAEFTSLDFDIYSNGFKPRHTNNAENASGGTYVFCAFASNPFGGSGVSPATAR